MSRDDARARVLELFTLVGIPDPKSRFSAYPHQLSGGLKQRVMIAMAMAMRPRLLIADEPTTALDATIRAQILELLRDLSAKTGTAVLLITHDFGVVNEVADRVAVMYAGRIVEEGTRVELLSRPRHPYTQGLIACRVALEFLDILEEDRLLENVRRTGAYFHKRLVELQDEFSFVRAVRGRGLRLALDLEFNSRPVVLEALQAGLLVNNTHDTVLRFLPPYIIGPEHVDRAVRILKRIFLEGRFPKDQPAM
jgi:ABC-type glutathione transport system ATPase component